MNEQQLAERFSHDLDDLLGDKESTSAGMPAEYAEALEIGRLLAATDLSTRSQLRQYPGRRLMHEETARGGWWRPGERTMSRIFELPKALVVTGALMLLLAGGFLFFPPARALADSLLAQIGAFTFTSDERHAEITLAPEPTATPLPSYGNGNIIPLTQASAEAGFSALAPGYVPGGYTLSVRLVTGKPGDEQVIVVTAYDVDEVGFSHDLILQQMRFAGDKHYELPVGDATTQEVEVNGARAIWIAALPTTLKQPNGSEEQYTENHLHWQAGEDVLMLRSRYLGLEEMIRVAESLAP